MSRPVRLLGGNVGPCLGLVLGVLAGLVVLARGPAKALWLTHALVVALLATSALVIAICLLGVTYLILWARPRTPQGVLSACSLLCAWVVTLFLIWIAIQDCARGGW